MADNSIVGNLFGIDPIALERQQQADVLAYNAKLANMDPLAAGKLAMMQGASQLGNVGQRLLGVQDPQMQQASELRSIANQFDLTNPAGLMQYAQAIQSKYPQYAQLAVAQANKMKESAATVYGKTREHLSTMGKLVSERDRLIAANPGDPRIAEYNKAIAAEGSSKTPQIALDVKMLDVAGGRRNTFINENKPLIEQGTAIQQAKTLLQTDSPFGEAGFENTVVSVFGGDKQKSKAEMARLANTGGFDERIKNSLSKFASGKVSDMTNQDRLNVLEALDGDIKRKYNARRTNTIKAASGVKDLAGQEEYMAPTYEEMVGGGAAAGRPAVAVGQTGVSQKYGNYKVLEVDEFGKPTKIDAEKGGVLTISGAK